jgi:hypothetical protein
MNTKSIPYVLFGFTVLMITSYFGNRIKKYFTELESKDNYELVKKYILSESALYGDSRPKLWIHTTYNTNARKWINFQSRNTTNLNQPYLYITIQSIINHCGDDFHICLIDDETFKKLLPSWDVDFSQTPEAMQSYYRDIGLMVLLYTYGGIIVPNSFLCSQSLLQMYKDGTYQDTPFICEKKNTQVLKTSGGSECFIPDIKMIGSKKNDPIIDELIICMKKLQRHGHFRVKPISLVKLKKCA